MNEHAHWWEPIFTGTLELGVDKEKLETANEESILYFGATTTQLEQPSHTK
ncbi:hypothetical protein [Planococcus sp. ISL-109]|uniref:hypothetical protein n=1 Tax=Planococcus sp. ISL-109 TaxID=2819166 RepID=UPI001BE64C70|nr:hypothetical protein [Planococcus sp. ISL-109]MBT2581762.1 hypothetical protein [Planococcus sp. ISL-109]